MNLKKQLLPICLLWLFTLPMVAFGKPLLSTSDTTRTKPNQLGIIPKATRTIDKEVMGHYRSFPELSDFVNQMQLETQTKTVVSGNTTIQGDILHIPMQQSIAEFTDEYIKSIYTAPALIAAAKDTAKSLFKLLEQTNNFIDKLAPASLVDLPVGLKKRVGNTMVMIGISQAKYFASEHKIQKMKELLRTV